MRDGEAAEEKIGRVSTSTYPASNHSPNSSSKHRTTMHTQKSFPNLFEVVQCHPEEHLEGRIIEAKAINRRKLDIDSREELVEARKFIA